ncbi:beta-phosphoglucomutase [Urechidicola croceus]|uniref:Beta-phosphoglucomutase n=1 Tax=Urechidicola croceus TaxID=1850246 RepID=A0A1D8P6X6_9FLAO|nr:beta-phosphoglucomutase [Urechidicola croceus]AOW20321.1 beta-phosphoglucomutase [Urechidicola croceus]
MSKKALIFDLDGVIVDTAKYHYKAWKKLANNLGFDFTEEQNELLKGVSRVKSLEILLEIGNVTLSDEEKLKVMNEKNEHYLGFITKMEQDEILEGIPEVLNYLRENKVPFSLGSASKNARLILTQLNLIDLFDAIVDGNDVSKAKPDPEVFLIAADKLKTAPENCIVVEDAIAGIEAANSAQMTSIGIGDKETLGEADIVLSSTAELNIELLEKLLRK